MERELRRIECVGADGAIVTVMEIQYVGQRVTRAGVREYPGARRFEIAGGAAVRVVDARTFEIVRTAELLHQVVDRL